MKKIIIITGAMLAGMLLVSCNNFLDTLPDNRTDVDTEEKITSLITSAYANYSPILVTEMMSDNVDFNGNNWGLSGILQEQAFYWQDISSGATDDPYNIWNYNYRAIANANLALQAIEKAGNPRSLEPQRGEALICRAYAHFTLVNFFCQHYKESQDTEDNKKNDIGDLGIPYMTWLETTVAPHYERKTVSWVYEQINKDIEEALPLISDNIYSAPKYHFNRQAAYAFAARFNLFYCKYEKVVEYANVVLGSNPRSVLRDWKELASKNDRDQRGYMFASDKSDANLLLIPAYSGNASMQYSAYARYMHNIWLADTETVQSQGIWKDWNNFHLKGQEWLGNPADLVIKMYYFREILNSTTGVGYTHNVVPVFTGDEVLLNRAEAYVMLAERADQDKEACYESAAEDINTWLRNFSTAATSRKEINDLYAGMPEYMYNNPTPKKKLNPDFEVAEGEQENFIQCLLHTRRVLFIHEGMRWYDIKRYGITIFRRQTLNGVSFDKLLDEMAPDSDRRAIQIPTTVVNAGMQPNPRNKR